MNIESLIDEACKPLELSEDTTTCSEPVKAITCDDIKNMMDHLKDIRSTFNPVLQINPMDIVKNTFNREIITNLLNLKEL